MIDQYILTPFFLDQALPGLESLREPDWQVNQPDLPEGSAQERMGVLYQPLSKLVAECISVGRRPVSIAGDCCTSIGVLSGLQQAGVEPLLIWFDAHGDFNTWETSPSGFLGGMPLAMLVGRGEQTIIEAVRLNPQSEAQVILTDGRDLDPGELLSVKDSQVRHLSNASELLDYPLPDRPIYVHFDTDIINPDEAPAMNYLAPGGPSASELESIFRRISASGNLVAASMSSWNPEMDSDKRTQQVCMRLFEILISG